MRVVAPPDTQCHKGTVLQWWGHTELRKSSARSGVLQWRVRAHRTLDPLGPLCSTPLAATVKAKITYIGNSPAGL